MVSLISFETARRDRMLAAFAGFGVGLQVNCRGPWSRRLTRRLAFLIPQQLGERR